MNGRPSKPEPGQLLEDYDWIKFIEYVFSLDISGDGKTCRINSTKTGKQLTIIFPEPAAPGQVSSAGSTEYNGYFTVKINDNDTATVHCGANPNSSVCGYVHAGNSTFSVATVTIPYTKGQILYCRIYYDTAYRAEIGAADTLPEVSQEHYEILYDDMQVWTGGVIDIAGKYIT